MPQWACDRRTTRWQAKRSVVSGFFVLFFVLCVLSWQSWVFMNWPCPSGMFREAPGWSPAGSRRDRIVRPFSCVFEDVSRKNP